MNFTFLPQLTPRTTLLAPALLLLSTVATAADKSAVLDMLTILGGSADQEKKAGSVHKVDKESLEQWRYTDALRVLESAPGVYIRQEDGYGLRPNIGMRGSGSDRSKKIALMEDGILFAPAPYSAPAAYYFPLMSRMQAVEVFKGPAAILYGPNTVGGAINFVSRDIPGTDDDDDAKGAIDIALGSDAFGKLHGFYGDSGEQFGWLLEGVRLQSDGFKALDGGGDTGFDKNDVLLKLRFNSDLAADVYHQFDVKVGYADEVSDETYVGISDADFNASPTRRYAASQRDTMDWDHQQYSVSHYFDAGGDYTLNTTLYRREFFRIWDKLNGFGQDAPSLSTILEDPASPINSIFYDVLTGESDSLGAGQTLLLGANQRDFVAQGIQTQLDWMPEIAGKTHDIRVSARFHQDQIERQHTENGYLMQSGQLVHDGNPTRTTTLNRANADALAVSVHDEVSFSDLILSGGMRAEFIDTEFVNRQTSESVSRSDDILIPGVGVNYRATPNLRVLGGVHKGFVPVPPGSAEDVVPEESLNYEFGLRYSNDSLRVESIGFFNDYSNLSGSCTFSSGCAASQLDLGFNAGEVDIWGMEFQLEKTISTGVEGRLRFPVSLAYTYTDSEFKNSFTSPQPDLKDVISGDKLPYLPAHQLIVKAGVTRYRWRAAVALKYLSEMRTTAGSGDPEGTDATDTQTVLDATLDYQITPKSQAYFTVDNLLDEAVIVARRPYGARPAKPLTVSVGYKHNF